MQIQKFRHSCLLVTDGDARVLLDPGTFSRGFEELRGLTAVLWRKVAEAVDYLRAVAPRIAVPIHEAVTAVPPMYYGHFNRLGPDGTTVQIIDDGEPATF